MIAQIILSLGVIIAFIYTILQNATTKTVRYMIYAVLFIGAYFIWNPEATTFFANAMGIGRGADLVTYFWIMLSLIFIIILHLKLRMLHEQITELSRSVALTQAKKPVESGENKV